MTAFYPIIQDFATNPTGVGIAAALIAALVTLPFWKSIRLRAERRADSSLQISGRDRSLKRAPWVTVLFYPDREAAPVFVCWTPVDSEGHFGVAIKDLGSGQYAAFSGKIEAIDAEDRRPNSPLVRVHQARVDNDAAEGQSDRDGLT